MPHSTPQPTHLSVSSFMQHHAKPRVPVSGRLGLDTIEARPAVLEFDAPTQDIEGLSVRMRSNSNEILTLDLG